MAGRPNGIFAKKWCGGRFSTTLRALNTPCPTMDMLTVSATDTIDQTILICLGGHGCTLTLVQPVPPCITKLLLLVIEQFDPVPLKNIPDPVTAPLFVFPLTVYPVEGVHMTRPYAFPPVIFV